MPYPKTAILDAIKELLKAGATRAAIQTQIAEQYSKSQRQIDDYLQTCQAELAADDAEIKAATRKQHLVTVCGFLCVQTYYIILHKSTLFANYITIY